MRSQAKKAQSHRGGGVEMCGMLLSLQGLSVQRKDSEVPGIKYCPEDGHRRVSCGSPMRGRHTG